MFGTVAAANSSFATSFNRLRFKLYRPYNNRECLHCHLGARSFEESEAHTKDPQALSRMKLNQLNCSTSGCHNINHNVGQLKDATFWKEQAK